MKRVIMLVVRWSPWLSAGLILTVMAFATPAFRYPGYWLNLGGQYFAPAALALALTPIILTGGIDLSVGSVAVFASVVIGALWRDGRWPMEWAIAGGIIAGLIAGLGNGMLVSAGIMPLVATLATRELYRGLALTLSGDAPVTRFPASLGELWASSVYGVPLPVAGVGLLFLLTYVLVHRTWIGRMVYAIGDNEVAAEFAAVPVRRIKLWLYAWSGLVAGLCGAALIMKYGAAKADAEKSLELTAIACVVVGGVRVTGGAGHVAGTLLGIVVVAALMGGLGSIAPAWRDTVTGAILVAVALGNEASARWLRRHFAPE
jgi:ribose/xylose/arabinose/galactoside ABC-type transport system permease subunit